MTLPTIDDDGVYRGYVYAYPHKTAYRTFDEPKPLREAWAEEATDSLFLYVHIPFCSMRCGFCNLFTQAKPQDRLVTHYLEALERQTERIRVAIPRARFARFAIGGGTPTYLSARELDDLFTLARTRLDVDTRTVPTAIEVSPDTLDAEKVALLKSWHVERVSIGVQSFFESETSGCGRPQSRETVATALTRLADANFPTLNIDLIYGLPGQTETSWLASIEMALAYEPEELFLYPLYVRPLTGLGRSRKEWDDQRLSLYRHGRDLLQHKGYEQISMRMFRRNDAVRNAEPNYCCQRDGMIGLGCGARSYTRRLHYSLDFAVHPKSVREIIRDYVATTDAEFDFARHGFALNAEEQRRRFVLQSILNRTGLDPHDYELQFHTAVSDNFPLFAELVALGYLAFHDHHWVLTPEGLERSDAIGPRLFSKAVDRQMSEYEQR